MVSPVTPFEVAPPLSPDVLSRRATGVVTEGGHTVKAENVINCGGMWARQLGQQAGVNIPNQVCEALALPGMLVATLQE